MQIYIYPIFVAFVLYLVLTLKTAREKYQPIQLVYAHRSPVKSKYYEILL